MPCMHGDSVMPCLHGDSVLPCLHDDSVMPCLHDDSVMPCLHDDSVMPCLYDDSVMPCLQGCESVCVTLPARELCEGVRVHVLGKGWQCWWGWEERLKQVRASV